MKNRFHAPLIVLASTLAIVSATALTMSIASAQQSPPQSRPNPNQAPEFTGGPWLNTKDGKPVTIESRRGKPTLVAFWTFACENCQANIPAYARLLAKYRAQGVELISIHTPEIKIEHNIDQVAKHVKEEKIDYPVLIDNANTNWNNWKVGVWPPLYVVDGDGIVRYHWFGELNWNNAGGEAKIAQVLDSLIASSRAHNDVEERVARFPGESGSQGSKHRASCRFNA